MLCDEATASVDPSAEAGIVKALRYVTTSHPLQCQEPC